MKINMFKCTFSVRLTGYIIIALIIFASFIISGYTTTSILSKEEIVKNNNLTGAWRGKVQFKSGVFESIKDLEFLYVFNEGGTMTESSNYDGVPPVPPAYGIWRKISDKQYEAKYTFYTTKPPKKFDEIETGGGWMPAGYGVLTEKITLSQDGKIFTSVIKLELYDQSGKTVDGGGEAETNITRMEF